MASAAPTRGRLAAVELAATTDTTIYSPAAGRWATVTVNICNRSTTAAKVRLLLVDAATVGTPADEDYLEYETIIPLGTPLERTNIIVNPGYCIAARSDGSDTNVQVWGIEQDI